MEATSFQANVLDVRALFCKKKKYSSKNDRGPKEIKHINIINTPCLLKKVVQDFNIIP